MISGAPHCKGGHHKMYCDVFPQQGQHTWAGAADAVKWGGEWMNRWQNG